MPSSKTFAALVATVTLAACGTAAPGRIVARQGDGRILAGQAAGIAHWSAFVHVARPLDLAGPRPGAHNGSLVLAAAGRLFTLGRAGAVRAFAAGPHGYRSPGGEEPYIVLSAGGCFGHGTVYALRLGGAGRSVVAVGASGRVRRLATVRAPGLLDGIAFDGTGRFGHRLLVTVNHGTTTTVLAIGCRGAVSTITASAPRVEGGIAVAPSTFGRFAGDLIAPGEQSGKLFAIEPDGTTVLLANSGLPHGNDIGVESEGFVPAGGADALVADRLTPGNPHPGDDIVLRLRAAALRKAGVRAGDLLVATEGGALTDAVHCTRAGCRVLYVADGPAAAHVEGHIAFAPTS